LPSASRDGQFQAGGSSYGSVSSMVTALLSAAIAPS
jgi:hypothetical protein